MQQVNGGYKNRKILKERMELKIQNEKMITKKSLNPSLPQLPSTSHCSQTWHISIPKSLPSPKGILHIYKPKRRKNKRVGILKLFNNLLLE